MRNYLAVNGKIKKKKYGWFPIGITKNSKQFSFIKPARVP